MHADHKPSGAPPRLWERTRQFLFHDVWTIELSSLSGVKGFLIHCLRVSQLLVKGFREDNLAIHAAALTFSTLLAIVPVLAIALSVARGLGAGQDLVARINEHVDQMPEAFRDYVRQNITQVTTADFYAIGGLGLLLLLVMAIQVMSSIETSFNIVWGIRNSRNILRKIAYYTSTLVVVPVLILAAGTLTATVRPLIEKIGLAAFHAGLLKLTPLLVGWIGFSFLYGFVPNTKVQLRPALVSGFVGAVLWNGWLRFYLAVQPTENVKFVYGAVAAVPLFLAWLFVSWVIVLLGAELAFAVQNSSTYRMERIAPRASVRAKMLLALSVVTRAAEALANDQRPFDLDQFAGERRVSIRLVNEVVSLLSRAGLLAEVAEHEGRYVLLRSPERVTVREVLDVVLNDGSAPQELGLQNLRDEIQQALTSADEGMSRAVEKLSISNLMSSAGGGGPA